MNSQIRRGKGYEKRKKKNTKSKERFRRKKNGRYLQLYLRYLQLLALLGQNIALSAGQAINIFLKRQILIKLWIKGNGKEDTTYFESDFDSVEELEENGKKSQNSCIQKDPYC